MAQVIQCPDCDNDEFDGPDRQYYEYQYSFSCSECGAVIVINESKED